MDPANNLSVRDLIRIVEFKDRPEGCTDQEVTSRLRSDRHNALTRLLDAAERLQTNREQLLQNQQTYRMEQQSKPLSEDHVRALRCLHQSSFNHGIARTRKRHESTAKALEMEMEQTLLTLHPEYRKAIQQAVGSKNGKGGKKIEEAQQDQMLVRTPLVLYISLFSVCSLTPA